MGKLQFLRENYPKSLWSVIILISLLISLLIFVLQFDEAIARAYLERNLPKDVRVQSISIEYLPPSIKAELRVCKKVVFWKECRNVSARFSPGEKRGCINIIGPWKECLDF